MPWLPRLPTHTPLTPKVTSSAPDERVPQHLAGKKQHTESRLELNTQQPGTINLLLIYPSTYLFIIYLFKESESKSHSVMSDSLQPHGLYSPWNSPGQNTGVGSLSLLQGIFPTQGLNPGLWHCKQILYQLSHKGSLRILERVAYPFSSGSSLPQESTWDRLHCRWFLYQLSYQGSPSI